ncbi:hypothetical protein [Streptomyces sp. NRRL S-1813]|uniref:hypothetical protein n=1 Tax=Streptomyces sp. NRRL S-1813 TaxID=1463888 RepID=UPI0004C9D5A9|nr:hypothetical protein [Streptomyces sp. NRRL S-1813]
MLQRHADKSLLDGAEHMRKSLTKTPLIPLADEQCDIVAELEFCNPAGSSKDRSALWILEQAIGHGSFVSPTSAPIRMAVTRMTTPPQAS